MNRLRALGDRLRALSHRDRRALALGAAILIPALAWVALVRPYLGVLADLQDRAASERALLERELAVLRQAPDVPERMATAERALARWEARFVRSANLPLAEAEVTTELETLARESRVLLEEVSSVTGAAVETEPREGLETLRLRVRGESDFPGVLKFVRGIEDGPLLFRIAGLSIQQPAGSGERAPQRGALAFELVVEAFAPE